MRNRDGRPIHPVAIGIVVVATMVATAGCGSGDPGAQPAPSVAASRAGAAGALDALITTGLQQLRTNDHAAATHTFQAALAMDPTDVYANYNLGYLAQDAGDDVGAVHYYAAAITADPSFAPALYNLAILTEGSDLPAAISLYRRVLATRPNDAGTLLRLGDALRRSGRSQEGLALIAEARTASR